MNNISAIGPKARGHSTTTKMLHKLPRLVTNVLSEEEAGRFHLEVRLFQVDKNLADPSPEMRIDSWWARDYLANKYPPLCKVAHALLPCFNGPQMEGLSNTMGDTLDAKSCRMQVHTMSAVQIWSKIC